MTDDAFPRFADRQSYELAISEPLFRLVTECIHHVSNDTKMLVRLDAVVASRAAQAAQGFPGQSIETMQGHLETLTTHGDIRITFGAEPSTAAQLAAACTRLAERLDRTVELADTLSLLLFDLTVDRASALLLERMLDEEARPRPTDGRPSRSGSTGEVIPIR